MYALLLTLLGAVSVDCSIVIQLAIDLDIKYTDTASFKQYEKDCCLGNGVKCENERVVELNWEEINNYNQKLYPEIQLPPVLRVFSLKYSEKSMLIKKLPQTLKVLDLVSTTNIWMDLDAFPNLEFIRLGKYEPDNMPFLPRLPDSLTFIDLGTYTRDILPLNPTKLVTLSNRQASSGDPRPFPKLPESIQYLDLYESHYFGSVSIDFKSIRYLYLPGNSLTGNLTISSPNITDLSIRSNNFDRLFLKNYQKLQKCDTIYNYFEPDDLVDLRPLQSICHFSTKSPPSPDCPNMILFLKQLNVDSTNIKYWNYISKIPNCCNDAFGIITCSSNRITSIYSDLKGFNGTINGTLLPDSLESLVIYHGELHGLFPNLTRLTALTDLNIEGNHLTGPIFGNLPQSITDLRIGYNELNGTFPKLKNLATLRASNNYFDAVEYKFAGTKYCDIDLSFNKIKGVVDLTNCIVGSVTFNS
eukprot:NODE_414_length_7911_cov_0.926011.p1 type:complete len:472 gc:universal NODE_414_length_7911_cov_0.926011:1798-383(-)